MEFPQGIMWCLSLTHRGGESLPALCHSKLLIQPNLLPTQNNMSLWCRDNVEQLKVQPGPSFTWKGSSVPPTCEYTAMSFLPEQKEGKQLSSKNIWKGKRAKEISLPGKCSKE